jgi:hypothetical protein
MMSSSSFVIPVTPGANKKNQNGTPRDKENTNNVLSRRRGKDDYLEKLRLDYIVPPFEEEKDDASWSSSSTTNTTEDTPTRPPTAPLTSTMLLRVADLGMAMTDNEDDDTATQIHYIDLSHKESTVWKGIFADALDRLVHKGISFLSNNTSPQHKPILALKTEVSTAKLLQKMTKLADDSEQRISLLLKETLIWSGTLASSNTPFFVARGIVPTSPRDVLHKLWDNTRTAEYNKYCLGRKTIVEFEPDLLLTHTCRGTKLVESETRVPFTSMSVPLSCLMHARPLDDHCEDEGYLILSRSLQTGAAGTGTRAVPTTGNNEILWGITMMRTVPGHPNLTDLTSLSQVQSATVPRFLAKRIGLMGIEDFFKNVRQPHTP